MKPIETRYGGVLFRSRLEARWAVFFTRLGLDWEYEEQGWKAGDRGCPYLPDFLLPDLGLYVEIKPTNAFLVDPEGVARWEAFAAQVANDFGHGRSIPIKYPGIKAEAVMVCGTPPDPERVSWVGPQLADWPYQRGWSVLGEPNWAWCVCPLGRHFDLQLHARGDRITCGCRRHDDWPGYWTGDDPRILNAYGAARSARFEHGEIPAGAR